VSLYKRELAKDEERRDPAFRAKAEDDVRLRQPSRVTITWDDLAGSQELDFDVTDTRACVALVGAHHDVSAKALGQFGCLTLPTLQNRWDDDAKLTVMLAPFEEGESKWNRFVGERMTELAEERFAARGGRAGAGEPSEGTL
jgi:hypothetical protein